MTAIEFIGFVIIFLSLSFLYLKHLAGKIRMRNDPEALKKQREEQIALMDALGFKTPKELRIPKPPEIVLEEEEEQEFVLPPSLKKTVPKKAIKLSSLEEFIVMKEILDKPRALKDFNDLL